MAKSGPFLGIGITKNFYEFASEALHIAIFENFIKSMTSCLSKLKNTPKGQLKLKCAFGVLKSSKTPTKFFPGFLP